MIAIGNPFGFTRTVTTGIVSALQRQIQAPNGFPIHDVIQTDASINPGNSGGPLLDASGRVIGINSQIATGGGQGSVGIGFAIPIDTAKKLLPKLKPGGKIEHAYLGVPMADVDEQLAQDLNLPVDEGALIQEVTEGSPADKAGLRGGRTQTSRRHHRRRRPDRRGRRQGGRGLAARSRRGRRQAARRQGRDRVLPRRREAHRRGQARRAAGEPRRLERAGRSAAAAGRAAVGRIGEPFPLP